MCYINYIDRVLFRYFGFANPQNFILSVNKFILINCFHLNATSLLYLNFNS